MWGGGIVVTDPKAQPLFFLAGLWYTELQSWGSRSTHHDRFYKSLEHGIWAKNAFQIPNGVFFFWFFLGNSLSLLGYPLQTQANSSDNLKPCNNIFSDTASEYMCYPGALVGTIQV